MSQLLRVGERIELAVAIVISHTLRIVLGDVSAVRVWPQAPRRPTKPSYWCFRLRVSSKPIFLHCRHYSSYNLRKKSSPTSTQRMTKTFLLYLYDLHRNSQRRRKETPCGLQRSNNETSVHSGFSLDMQTENHHVKVIAL